MHLSRVKKIGFSKHNQCLENPREKIDFFLTQNAGTQKRPFEQFSLQLGFKQNENTQNKDC